MEVTKYGIIMQENSPLWHIERLISDIGAEYFVLYYLCSPDYSFETYKNTYGQNLSESEVQDAYKKEMTFRRLGRERAEYIMQRSVSELKDCMMKYGEAGLDKYLLARDRKYHKMAIESRKEGNVVQTEITKSEILATEQAKDIYNYLNKQK